MMVWYRKFLVQFDSGKLRYSHRFADLGSGAPRICLFFSRPSCNLIPIGYAPKYRGGGANFDISLPSSCHPSTAELSERNQLGQKRKTARRPNCKGETLSRFQITALPLLLNTLKNVFGRCIVANCSTTVVLSKAPSLQECIWPNPHPRTKAGG